MRWRLRWWKCVIFKAIQNCFHVLLWRNAKLHKQVLIGVVITSCHWSGDIPMLTYSRTRGVGLTSTLGYEMLVSICYVRLYHVFDVYEFRLPVLYATFQELEEENTELATCLSRCCCQQVCPPFLLLVVYQLQAAFNFKTIISENNHDV